MSRKPFVKKVMSFALGFAFMGVVCSSCHRGYGCPGAITDHPNQPVVEQQMDNDC